MTRKLIIQPGHYLIFRLGIHTTEAEGAFDGYVYVETSYHTFKVTCLKYTLALFLSSISIELNKKSKSLLKKLEKIFLDA